MMTIVTDVHLKQGADQEWDSVMRERLTAARKQPGWIGGQVLQPEERPRERVIVGTWRTRSDWEKWHEDPEFAETRQTLDGLSTKPSQHSWNEVVVDVRRAGSRKPAAQQRGRRRTSKRKSRR
jgi:heme-degrading monooxygenase HmoA